MRQKLPKELRRVPVTVRLPPETAKRLKKASQLTYTSQADIVASALDPVLAKIEKRYCAESGSES